MKIFPCACNEVHPKLPTHSESFHLKTKIAETNEFTLIQSLERGKVYWGVSSAVVKFSVNF